MKSDKQIIEFIKQQNVSFIASVDGDGFPNMKAMLPPRIIEGNIFYFTTNTSSLRAHQYTNNEKASIYFYNKGNFHYEGVMLIGTMEVLNDALYKQLIWKEGDTMYYQEGVNDPDYCVLRFTAEKGRHYCDFHSESFEFGKNLG